VLGGFLQVGPAFYPELPRGAQIIQRGPHGHRFAADPVVSRLTGQQRGSGFRWWKEQMDAGGDYEGYWQPNQIVEGVMGLGAAPDVSSVVNCPPGAPPMPTFPAPPPGDPARAVYAELQRAIGAACRGRIDPARKFATEGVDYFMRRLQPHQRSIWEAHRSVALAYIGQASSGAEGRLTTQLAREQAFQGDMQAWNRANAQAGRQAAAAEIEAARRGQLAYSAHLFGSDPSGAAGAAITGTPPAAWSRANETAGERLARGECVGIDPACWVRNNWWKAALAAGALALLYGAGKGAGGQLF